MKYKKEIIDRNSVKCLKCGDEIISFHRHDFKYCSCRNVAVDGGREYLKRVYSTKEWQDTSLVEYEDVEYNFGD